MTYYLKKNFNSRVYGIPIIIFIIALPFGSIPHIMSTKYNVKIVVDVSPTFFAGFDILGSWIGKYKDGVIIYNQIIETKSITNIKESEKEIYFEGLAKTKYGLLPTEITLKSKPSKRYFKEIIKPTLPKRVN